jgi:acetyltransferase-like isoleucine patch superfamily enzyme
LYAIDGVNPDYLAQRLLGRATCRIASGARLGWHARIRNARGDRDRIGIGAGTIVQGELLVFAHGGRISIGDWCFVGEGTRIWSAAEIVLEDRVLVSHNVNIFDSLTHPLSARQRHAQFRAIVSKGHPIELNLGEKPVRIMRDALIGAGAFILRGVTVGAESVVGAGSVVTRDVPPLTVVAGNPARVIRQLEPDEH